MGGIEQKVNIFGRMLHSVRQKARKHLPALALASLSGFVGISKLSPAPPKPDDARFVLEQTGVNIVKEECLFWSLASAACAGIFTYLTLKGVNELRKAYAPLLEPVDNGVKQGFLDFAAEKPFVAAGLVPLALASKWAYGLASNGTNYNIDDYVILAAPSLTAIPCAYAATVAGLYFLQFYRRPALQNLVAGSKSAAVAVKNINSDDLSDFKREYSRNQSCLRLDTGIFDLVLAAEDIAKGSNDSGFSRLENSVLKMHQLEKVRKSVPYALVDSLSEKLSNKLLHSIFSKTPERKSSLSYLSLDAVFSSKSGRPGRAQAAFDSYLEKYGEDAGKIHSLAAFIFSAFGYKEHSRQHIDAIVSSGKSEIIGDYEVFRLLIEQLNHRELILKRHNSSRVLFEELENLGYFIQHNYDRTIGAAWPLGVVSSDKGPCLVETVAAGEVAYAVLSRTKSSDVLKRVLKATAKVHSTMPVPSGSIEFDSYEKKVSSLGIPGVSASARRLLASSANGSGVFDNDSHLDNFSVSENNVTVYDMSSRGQILPQHDVARCIGLVPEDFSTDALNECVDSGYVRNSKGLPPDFVSEVHLAVPLRALSYASAMQKRRSMRSRIFRFASNGLKSADFVMQSRRHHCSKEDLCNVKSALQVIAASFS